MPTWCVLTHSPTRALLHAIMPPVPCQVGALVGAGHHTLLMGHVGVGKTMALTSLLEALPQGRSHCVVNFSAQTTSNSLQVR